MRYCGVTYWDGVLAAGDDEHIVVVVPKCLWPASKKECMDPKAFTLTFQGFDAFLPSLLGGRGRRRLVHLEQQSQRYLQIDAATVIAVIVIQSEKTDDCAGSLGSCFTPLP